MEHFATHALSIQQPWAWLIAHGHKTVENRTWRTTYRGPVLIHAGLKVDREAEHHLQALRNPADGRLDERLAGIRYPPFVGEETEVGGIVGVCDILDCITRSRSRWFVGPYGFVLANARPLPFMPLKGRLGVFPATYVRPEVA